MINPNLKHLRIFVEIARRGSFRNAALAMHLSEPATSQAINQLEKILAIKLLDRTTRSMRLTEAGASFLPDAERLLQGMDHAIATLREFATTGRGRVSVACLSSTVYHLLPPALAEMKRRHPGINVVYRDDNMRGILKSLETGECDVAIVSDSPKDKRSLAIPLVTDEFLVLCPASHRLARQPHVTGQELATHELVLLGRGSAIREAFDHAIEPLAIRLQIVHETAQIHTLLGLVEAGLGITVLPAMLCPAASHTQFVAKRLIQPSLQRTLGLIFPAGREPTAAARVLADVIRSTVLSENLQTPWGVQKIMQ